MSCLGNRDQIDASASRGKLPKRMARLCFLLRNSYISVCKCCYKLFFLLYAVGNPKFKSKKQNKLKQTGSRADFLKRLEKKRKMVSSFFLVSLFRSSWIESIFLLLVHLPSTNVMILSVTKRKLASESVMSLRRFP